MTFAIPVFPCEGCHWAETGSGAERERAGRSPRRDKESKSAFIPHTADQHTGGMGVNSLNSEFTIQNLENAF